MRLKLRYLWGAPKEWTFEGDDERTLRAMFRDLDGFKADLKSRAAVLVAETDEGENVGAWNRDGARRLASTIVFDPPSPEWLEVRNALDDAVTGP